MKFDQTTPCKECPYLALVAGWIGAHESAMDFHQIVRNDQEFPCHMTTEAYQGKPVTEQHCAGYAMYMNADCKVSNNPNIYLLQEKVRSNDASKLLHSFDGSKIVEFHGK